MTLKQTEDTVEKVREGNLINRINEVNETEEPSRENEKISAEENLQLDAETKELKDEILRKILQIKFTNTKDRQTL